MKIRKYWLIALMVILIASLSACSNEKDNDKEVDLLDSPLVGDWVECERPYGEEVISFGKNKTYTWTVSYSGDSDIQFESGTYTVNGETVTIKCTKKSPGMTVWSDINEVSTFNWYIRNNTLYLTDSSDNGEIGTYTRL